MMQRPANTTHRPAHMAQQPVQTPTDSRPGLAQRAALVGLCAAAALLAACGGSPSDAPAPPVLAQLPVAAPTPYVPGTGFWQLDSSALAQMTQPNAATATVATDGGATVLTLRTTATPVPPAAGANPVGAFVGGGQGNKVVVGLDGFDGLKLSDLGQIELDAKLVTGPASNFYMNFLVDLDCVKDEDASLLTITDMRLRRRIVVWNPAGGVVQPDGYTRYSVAPADLAWNIVGSPALGMVPNPSSPAGALGLTGYPNACIVDGISADGGLPRNRSIPACITGAGLAGTASAQCGLPHKGALILLGDSATFIQKEWNVKRVKIKDRLVTVVQP